MPRRVLVYAETRTEFEQSDPLLTAERRGLPALAWTAESIRAHSKLEPIVCYAAAGAAASWVRDQAQKHAIQALAIDAPTSAEVVAAAADQVGTGLMCRAEDLLVSSLDPLAPDGLAIRERSSTTPAASDILADLLWRPPGGRGPDLSLLGPMRLWLWQHVSRLAQLSRAERERASMAAYQRAAVAARQVLLRPPRSGLTAPARRRVGLVHSRSRVSGAGTCMTSLFATLNPQRWETTTVLSKPGDMARRFRAAGSKIAYVFHRLPVRGTPNGSSDVFESARFRRTFDRAGLDLIHLNYPAAGALLAARSAGIPVIQHFHIFDLWSRGLFDSSLMWLADRYISITNHGKELVSSLGVPPDRVDVVHNGVDLHAFSPQGARLNLRRLPGLNRRSKVIGCVARYERWKRLDRILAAFAKVRERSDLDAHLVMLAPGTANDPVGQEFASWVEARGLEGSVHVLPVQSEMPPFYRALDLLVLGSDDEPYSRALIEAIAAGVPCVAIASAGVRELSGPEGLVALVEPGSREELTVERLAIALESALLEPPRRGAIPARLDVVESAVALEAAYERAIADGRGEAIGDAPPRAR